VRRTERLFAIAEHLRARRTGVTAAALAERFGVTIRTIYRDLDGLRDASLPLLSERGRGGGYALDRAYSLPPVNFTAREAAVLLTAGRWITVLRAMPFLDTLGSALDKVEAALPARSRRDLAALLGSLTFTGVPARAVRDGVRRAVETALFERRPLAITYEGTQGRSVRRVRIESVVLERSEVLLNCVDLDKGEARQFRLHNVIAASVVEEPAPAAPAPR
jgi:predicted DNA-binding transcriptional regulator YafY